MTDRELMQMALEAMEHLHRTGDTQVFDLCYAPELIPALRERLAQPEPKPVATLFGSLPVYDVPPKQEPVAWRTFDGEGGYEFRSYEMNENYAEEWAQRNPNHKGWVEPLYKDPTPCQTCESLARTVMMDQTSHDTAPPHREWQSLTDEEITETLKRFGLGERAALARAIEAKLKEKNNG